MGGFAATPASTPTPPHLSILQVNGSLLHRNTPVSSNATGVTRSISEKLVDAWVKEHLRSLRLPVSNLPVGCHLTTQGMLVSVIRSGCRDATDRRSFEARVIFIHRTLQPGGLNVDFGFI